MKDRCSQVLPESERRFHEVQIGKRHESFKHIRKRNMIAQQRLSTGMGKLDRLLGGGLIPGTLTVVLGATGIGKTQLGIQFSEAGRHQEGERGIIFDMTSRGDSQNHADYAKKLFQWDLSHFPWAEQINLSELWNSSTARSDYAHLFERSGRRISIQDMELEEWKELRIELMKKLDRAIAFFYGNFIHGVRRCVIDGMEPTDRASDSFQMHVFDYVYHQILRKESAWVARDLLRVRYRANEKHVEKHPYDHEQIGCLLMLTTHEVMLDALLERPIETGDVLSNANTIILMGKTRSGTSMGRALYVAKHRGSYCGEEIVPFQINEKGLELLN